MRTILLLAALTLSPVLARAAENTDPATRVSLPAVKQGAVEARTPEEIRSLVAEHDTRIQRMITQLFQSYEQRSVAGLRPFLGNELRTRDTLGFGYGAGQVYLSLSGDFRNLTDIKFKVLVFPPQYSRDFRQARVDLQWDRTCRFARSGQEWIKRNQRTTMFVGLVGPQPRLVAVEGAPALALSTPTGVTIVDSGTVDGRETQGVTGVLNGVFGEGEADLFRFGGARRLATPGEPFAELTLFPSDITVLPNPPPGNAPFIVQIRFRNTGNLAANHVQMQAVIRRNGFNLSSQLVEASVPAAGTTVVTFNDFTPHNNFPGANTVITVTGVADCFNDVDEPHETNNQATATFTTQP